MQKKAKYLFISCRILALMLIVGFLGVGASSCKRSSPVQGEKPIARVQNAFLYKSDIRHLVPANALPADSAHIVQRYIDAWVKQQVFLQQALRSLPAEKMNFDKQIEEYRNSLISFSFEKELIAQELDTLITERQLAQYYEQNKSDFVLRNNIVRVNYIKLPLDAPDLNQFRRYFRSNDPETEGWIEDYCVQNAATFYIDSNTWLIFDDLLRELPLQVSNPANYLSSNKSIELTDGNYRYFVNFIEYQLRGGQSPLEMERDNVRSIILNQRKHEFIAQRRNQLYQEALRNNQIEIFTNK
jgi:hypothetical protein